MPMYCIIFVELLEKFDSVIENEPQAEVESNYRAAKFAKFKLKMTLGIAFTFTWYLARLLVVLVSAKIQGVHFIKPEPQKMYHKMPK